MWFGCHRFDHVAHIRDWLQYCVCCSSSKFSAEDTPLTTLALAKLWEKAGGPPGVLNVVPTSRNLVQDVGSVLTTHEAVKKVRSVFLSCFLIGTLEMYQ